jgi:hypothetical protein
MRELALTFVGLTLTLLMSGCESTESESARLGREGAKLVAAAGTVGLGRANQMVHVGQVALVQSEGRTAAAVQLTDTGSVGQTNVPVLIDVMDAKGASVYRNNTQGIEPSLQEIALLRPHRPTWWVDDQVLVSGIASSTHVRVGAAKSTPSDASAGGVASAGASAANAGADVQASVVGLGSNVGGPYLDGTVVNRTGVAQHNMPVFAVALRGGRVVGAGRALVPSLAASGSARSASFRIYLVGSTAGAHIELSPVPEVAR